jgi:dTDP-4-dehydrorhamnose 3,5-epimerase
LTIPDVKLIQPDVYEDARGSFFESWQQERFLDAGIKEAFVQDNQSISGKGVLRGLHFQNPPYAQGKLVRVVKGAVLDVAVDLRSASPTFGKWVSQLLSEENRLMMWVPPGFAHGFITREEENIFLYKCTAYYNKASECTILWNDPQLNIDWGNENPLLSEKDLAGIKFSQLKSLF